LVDAMIDELEIIKGKLEQLQGETEKRVHEFWVLKELISDVSQKISYLKYKEKS